MLLMSHKISREVRLGWMHDPFFHQLTVFVSFNHGWSVSQFVSVCKTSRIYIFRTENSNVNLFCITQMYLFERKWLFCMFVSNKVCQILDLRAVKTAASVSAKRCDGSWYSCWHNAEGSIMAPIHVLSMIRVWLSCRVKADNSEAGYDNENRIKGDWLGIKFK